MWWRPRFSVYGSIFAIQHLCCCCEDERTHKPQENYGLSNESWADGLFIPQPEFKSLPFFRNGRLDTGSVSAESRRKDCRRSVLSHYVEHRLTCSNAMIELCYQHAIAASVYTLRSRTPAKPSTPPKQRRKAEDPGIRPPVCRGSPYAGSVAARSGTYALCHGQPDRTVDCGRYTPCCKAQVVVDRQAQKSTK